LSGSRFALITVFFLAVIFAAYEMPQAKALPCNCVVIRMDDVQDFWLDNAQISAMNVFTTKNIKMTPALIMNYYGNDPTVVSKVREGYNSGLFELALHGWDHVDYTKLSLSAQQTTLSQSNTKLFGIYGTTSQIFVPPYNLFNTNTLQAMKNTGYTMISSDKSHDAYPFTDTYGIKHIPATIDFGYTSGSHRVIRSSTEILNAINTDVVQKGYAVFYFHQQDFVQYKGKKATTSVDPIILNQFSGLVDSIRSKYNVVHFSEVTP
jgi:peptidoglycan/xylan/chitin deacetylase (PgdA/CDA1 family)